MKPVLLQGDLVLVEAGLGTIHCPAKIAEPFPGDPPEFIWLDVNMMGVHLPQRYRVDEIKGRLEVPHQASEHGFCTDCMGFGLVHTSQGVRECETCGGSGRSSIYVVMHRTASMSEAMFEIDQKKVAEIVCDVCRMAATPQ